MNKKYKFFITGFLCLFFFLSFFQSSQAGFFDWFGWFNRFNWINNSNSQKTGEIIPDDRNMNKSSAIQSSSSNYPASSRRASSSGLSSSDRSASSISSRRNKYSSSSSSVKNSSVFTVLSPNGGESWVKGSKQKIRWQDDSGITCKDDYCPQIELSLMYDIELIPYYPPCVGQYCPASPYIAPHIIAKGVRGGSYDWLVGNVKDVYENDKVIYDGKYTVQVCIVNSNECDISDSYFKMISPIVSPSSGSKY